MSVTVEEVKAFLADADKARQPWLTMAKRSWDELKKRQKNYRLWSVTPNSLRRRARYPAWYSIFKIRQPLLLSRIGIPIGKDMTQDGNDNIGATAAICLERLAVNLARSFDFFDVMAASRDDFLATCFGEVRAYYERDEVKERVKERLTAVKTENGDVVFLDGAGKIVESDDIGQDDEGFFLELDKVVDVENERICLEPVLYSEIYVDPGVRRWKRAKRIAYAEYYSREEFKEIFGLKALQTIPDKDDKQPGADEAYPKRQEIRVYEYWDFYEKKTYWLADNGSDFITPQGYYQPSPDADGDGDDEPLNGLYSLEGFFPSPPPLMNNQPTDEFWPVPEFYQLVEVFEDIHTLFSRMVVTTRAYRARLLFDNNVDGLQEALNEAAEGDSFGVPNLAQSLAAAGGSLDNVVQYLPTEGIIKSLEQLYVSLEQRLNVVYKLTGTSDLLQGLITDPTQRTLGERQMTEKYALNQIAEPQRKMQEFVRSSYQLLCEMALKNFKDASLDKYIIPQTLSPEHRQRYGAAIGMLKEDSKRFRIELETDSTIALNEEYDKQMRVELVNTLTSALQNTASVAETSPALVVPELHAMKYLVQGFRQGKMFQTEITQAIDNVIKAAEQATPAFNKDEAAAKLKAQELEINSRVEQFRIASAERLEAAKLAQAERFKALEAQLDSMKTQQESAQAYADLQLKYQELSAEIQQAREKLALDREALYIEAQKIADKRQADQIKAVLDEQVAATDAALATAAQRLEEQRVMLDEQEKYMTEERLQSEHDLNQLQTQMEIAAQFAESQNVETPPEPPVHLHIESPTPVKKQSKTKIEQDGLGNVTKLETMEIEEP